MAIVFSIRVVLMLSVLLHSVSTTRFLPSMIWDNVSPLLCCPYNWLVVPRVDLHDILDFVCPTSKLIVKQVNYNTRIAETMNFNLFRREWTGTTRDLQKSIATGSIHSFCNVSHPDSVKLHTCENGKYSSFPVKFTHFVFDQSRAKYEKYEKDKTYVFYSNGDGLVSSLDSKEAKCNMLFAVHTVKSEQHEFAITYGKEAVPSKCECNTSMKPTLDPTTTMTTPQEPSTPTHPSTTVQSPTTTEETTTPVTPSTAATSKEHTTKKEISNTLKNIDTLKTTKPTESYVETEDNWLSIPILIAIIVATFICGILSAVLFFQLYWRKPMSKDGYNMNHGDFAHRQLQPSGTPDGTISECISNV